MGYRYIPAWKDFKKNPGNHVGGLVFVGIVLIAIPSYYYILAPYVTLLSTVLIFSSILTYKLEPSLILTGLLLGLFFYVQISTILMRDVVRVDWKKQTVHIFTTFGGMQFGNKQSTKDYPCIIVFGGNEDYKLCLAQVNHNKRIEIKHFVNREDAHEMATQWAEISGKKYVKFNPLTQNHVLVEED